MGKSVQQHVDGDVTEVFAQKYRDMMPFEVVGVYSPETLACPFGSTNKNRDHLYTVVTTDDQFYVGITGREPTKRWREHLGKGYYSGAEFLKDKKIAAFILVRTRIRRAEDAENRLTVALKDEYGRKNVTGGEFVKDEHIGLASGIRTDSMSGTSPFDSTTNKPEVEPIPLFPTESKPKPTKPQFDKEDIKPTVGHKLVIGSVVLFIGTLIGYEQLSDTMVGYFALISWTVAPIGIYLDTRKQTDEWPIWWWAYAMFAWVPFLNVLVGIAYLSRRRNLGN